MAECNGNLFETDIGALLLLFAMMKAGRRLLHYKFHRDHRKGAGSTRNLPGVRRSIPVYCREVSRSGYFRAASG
jgi:hypothetical protein